jgi:hypothetical protein
MRTLATLLVGAALLGLLHRRHPGQLSPHGQWMASRLFAAVGPDQGSPEDDGDDSVAMAVAPDGSVVLAGDYTGAIDLGLGPLPTSPQFMQNPVLARFGH